MQICVAQKASLRKGQECLRDRRGYTCLKWGVWSRIWIRGRVWSWLCNRRCRVDEEYAYGHVFIVVGLYLFIGAYFYSFRQRALS